MGKGYSPSRNTEFGRDFGGTTDQNHSRRPQIISGDGDVLPVDAVTKPGPKSLEDRFLGCEPSRDSFCTNRGSDRCIGDLGFDEAAMKKTVAVILEHSLDSLDLDQINTMADDVHERPRYLPRPNERQGTRIDLQSRP